MPGILLHGIWRHCSKLSIEILPRWKRVRTGKYVALLSANPRLRDALFSALRLMPLLQEHAEAEGGNVHTDPPREAAAGANANSVTAVSPLAKLAVNQLVQVPPPMLSRRWPHRWLSLIGVLSEAVPSTLTSHLGLLCAWACAWLEKDGSEIPVDDDGMLFVIAACQIISQIAIVWPTQILTP